MTSRTSAGLSVLVSMLVPLLVACSTEGHRPQPRTAVAVPVPVAATASEEEELLQCAVRIRAMSAGELNLEADTLQRAWVTRRSEDNRLRLALFLAVAPAPQGDRLRALSLLDVTPSEQNGRGRLHPLAQVLLPLLQDYRRLDDAATAQQQKLRELQQSSEQMRQKLDALREIETQLQERPKTK